MLHSHPTLLGCHNTIEELGPVQIPHGMQEAHGCTQSILELVRLWLRPEEKPDSISPSQYPIPQTDLKCKDIFNECIPKNEARASFGIAQEDLQMVMLHGRREISMSSCPNISFT